MAKEEPKEEGTISLSDVVALQESLKKDIDFDKPDDELTPDEFAKKALYSALDKTVEEKIGREAKENIDHHRETMEKLTTFKTNLNKLAELGREIEKMFVLQGAYIINHFDKTENNHYFLITRQLTDHALNENTSTEEKIAAAQKILEVINIYEEKVVGDLNAKQEIVDALLASFEKNFKETDFDVLGEQLEDKQQAKNMAKQFEKWLSLSKDLLKNRKKGIEALQEDLEIDQIVPRQLIENEGDTTKKFSGVEMTSKGDRMVRLVKESDEAEKKIDEERSQISIELFGKQDEYMDFGGKEDNSKQAKVSHNPLEVKAWFRFLKVVYIALWISGFSFVILLSYASGEFSAFVLGSLIVWGIMALLKKAFFYIALGNK